MRVRHSKMLLWILGLGAAYFLYTKWRTGPSQSQGPTTTTPPSFSS